MEFLGCGSPEPFQRYRCSFAGKKSHFGKCNCKSAIGYIVSSIHNQTLNKIQNLILKFHFKLKIQLRCVSSGEAVRSEEHTSELQSRGHLVCRLLLEKKKQNT